MYGLIHDSIRQLFIKLYGEDFWKKAMAQAGFESGKENIVNHYYSDTDTYAIVDAVSNLAKISNEEVWEMYGGHLIRYTMNLGWDEMIRYLSPDLKTFLNNLDSMHYFVDHVVYKAGLRGPTFLCEEGEDNAIILHYFTGRAGLYPIVKGVLREVARLIFNMELSITVGGRTQRSVQMASGERVEEHVIFVIKASAVSTHNSDVSLHSLSSVSTAKVDIPSEWQLRVSQNDFIHLLPYHFILDRDCKLLQIGRELAGHISPDLLQFGVPITRIFEIHRPQIPLDFENIFNFINGVFVLQVKTPPAQSANSINKMDSDTNLQAQHLKLKGQMMLMEGGDKIIYLCSPYVTSIPELLQYGLRLSAMPLHDATRDLILLNQQRLSDVEANLQLEANYDKLEAMARELEDEKKKTDDLLKEVLPSSVADQLMAGAAVDAREFEEATVMFSDVPGFQDIVSQCQPTEIVAMLNSLFTKFDRLVGIHDAYKVETVGDSYMTVGGAPEYVPDHAERVCNIALGMLWEARTVNDPVNKRPFMLRCGVHTGPIVAGVVGQKMPRYCLFGDTVNTASRMESHSPPGRIHLSQAAHDAAQRTGRFDLLFRGSIPIKGKGFMDTYFLKQSQKKSVWELVDRQRDENQHSIDGYAELNVNIEQDAARPAVKPSRSCRIV